MRFSTLLILSSTLLILTGCEYRAGRQVAPNAETVKAKNQVETRTAPANREEMTMAKTANYASAEAVQQNVSLNQADAANAASQAIERKIIRDGNLTIEVSSPTESQKR